MNTPEPVKQEAGKTAPPRPCPGCKRLVMESEPTFPFCSKRCKLLDLARWAEGDYKISRPADDSDFEET